MIMRTVTIPKIVTMVRTENGDDNEDSNSGNDAKTVQQW